jgi:hypothetical protein
LSGVFPSAQPAVACVFIQSSVAKSKIYERIYKIYKLNVALESKQGVNRGEAAWALNLKRKIQVRALAAKAVMLF